MRTKSVIILMILLPVVAGAQGKVTVDPNLPVAKSEVGMHDNHSKLDTRLAQQIEYTTKHKAVVDILDDLSEMTGVKLYAGYNAKDWQVRDRKMNIFSEDTNLADIMSSIARVMKFKWQTSGEGDKTTYRLYMDRKALLDAETQSLRYKERVEKEFAEKRMQILADYGKLGNLSPQELEKLRVEKPFMYVAASSGIVGALGGFFSEVPPALEAVATGQELVLNAGNLSPIAQQNIVQSVMGFETIASQLAPNYVGTSSDDISDNMNQVTVHLNRNMEQIESSPMRSALLGDMHITYKNKDIDLPFFDPDSKFANLIGEMLLEAQECGKPVNEVMKSRQAEFMACILSEMKSDDSGEPVNEHPDDPELQSKIKLESKGNRLVELQSAFAESAGFCVVSDSFGTRGIVNFGDEEISVQDVLEKIADGFHYNWDKRSSVIEFRDRNWFRKRSAQIPQAWIDGWKQTLKETGTLDLADLAQIAVLTQEQFNVNIMSDEDLMRSRVYMSIYPSRDLLRFYAGLSNNERTAMFSESELDIANLSAEDWEALVKLITLKNAAYLEEPMSPMTIKCTRTPKEGQPEYVFTISSIDDLAPIRWTVMAPEYQKPPEEKPKEAKPEQDQSTDSTSPSSTQ